MLLWPSPWGHIVLLSSYSVGQGDDKGASGSRGGGQRWHGHLRGIPPATVTDNVPGMELSASWPLGVIILKLAPKNPVWHSSHFTEDGRLRCREAGKARLWGGGAENKPRSVWLWGQGKASMRQRSGFHDGTHLVVGIWHGDQLREPWHWPAGVHSQTLHLQTAQPSQASSLLWVLGSSLVKWEQPQCLLVRVNWDPEKKLHTLSGI